MFQGEHSAIFSTVIKLPFVIKILVLSIFEWPFYTGFTVPVGSGTKDVIVTVVVNLNMRNQTVPCSEMPTSLIDSLLGNYNDHLVVSAVGDAFSEPRNMLYLSCVGL